MAPQTPIERLSRKLLAIIFQAVATDTGESARSLSLVSKTFNQISAPYKYQSIYLRNSKQIAEFNHHLSRLPIEHRGVKYLYASGFYDPLPEEEKNDSDYDGMSTDSEGDDGMNTDGSSEGSNDSDYEGMLTSDEQLELIEDAMDLVRWDVRHYIYPSTVNHKPVLDNSAIVLKAFKSILTEVGPTLEFLAVAWSSARNYIQLQVFLVPLPTLKELHIHRSVKAPPAVVVTSDTGFQLATVPSLRRLSVDGYLEQYWHALEQTDRLQITTSERYRDPQRWLKDVAFCDMDHLSSY